MSLRDALIAAVAAGLAGLSSTAADAAPLPTLARAEAGAPTNLGTVVAVDPILEDRPLFRIRVRMDAGEARTIVQQRLNDLRIGDRAEVDGGVAYRHDTRADRIDRWGYWVDAKGHRYDDYGVRVEDVDGDSVATTAIDTAEMGNGTSQRQVE